MLTRLVILAALVAVAVVVAMILQRRRPEPPSAPSYRAPTQLDPDDFAPSVERWLVVLFGSLACDTCPRAWEVVDTAVSDLSGVTAVRVDVEDDPDIHKRYRIDGVPTTVVASGDGVVERAFFGLVSADVLVGIVGR